MENRFHEAQPISPFTAPFAAPDTVARRGSAGGAPTDTAVAIRRVRSSASRLQSYGSEVFHANWIDELPTHERRTARRLNQLIQALPAERRSSKLPARSQTLLAAVQLSILGMPALTGAHHAPASAAHSPQQNGGTAAAPYAMPIDKFDHVSAAAFSSFPAREKRAVAANTIDTRRIPNHIVTILFDVKYPYQFRHRLDDLFRAAEISPEVTKAIPADQRNTRLLLQCLALIIAAVTQHPATNDFDREYHFFHMALRDFWGIALHLSEPRSKKMIDTYRQQLQQEKWRLRPTNMTRENGNPDTEIADEYIQFDHINWSRRGVNCDDEVLFHRPDTARMFSLRQILKKEHLAFIAGHATFSHFQFDNSGLPDDELTDFIAQADTQQFEEFKRASPDLLPEGYYQIDADRLLQAHLEQIVYTPLRFRKQQKIQEIISANAIPPSSRPSQHRAQKELNIALTNLALQIPQYDLLGYSAIAFANSILSGTGSLTFSELKNDDILYADYVYRYEDSDGRIRYDTATLAEFLSQGTDSLFIDLARRSNVHMLWPKEFSSKLLAYLKRNIDRVNAFSRNLSLAREINDIRNDLTLEMPSFAARLTRIFSNINKRAGVHYASFADRFTFTYHATTFNPEVQAALRHTYPPVQMEFTASQILLGAQRKWRSRNYNYNEEVVTGGPSHLPAGKLKSYAAALQDFPTQNSITQALDLLKQDPMLRNHYYKYLSLLSSRAKKENTWRYEFYETPLMAIYLHGNEPSMANTTAGQHQSRPPKLHFPLNLTIPMTVLSIPSGTMHHFNSLQDMQRRLHEDKTLWNHFKSHFPVDYDEDLSALALVRKPPDGTLYERMIDWEISNIDKIIESHTEADLFEILERLSNISFLLALPSLALGPGTGIIVEAFFSVGPKLLQAALSDTRQDRDLLIKDIVIELAAEVSGGIVSELFSRAVSAGLKKIIRPSAIGIKTTLQSLESSDSVFRSLDRRNQFHCRTSGQTGNGIALCWFSRKSGATNFLKQSGPLDSIRFVEPLRKIPVQVSEDLPDGMKHYLNSMLTKREILALVLNPAGHCMDVVPPVTAFLRAQDQDMRITYRAILIWDKLLDAYIPSPLNHFVVIYQIEGQRFVVDLTAAQFANRGMPSLNKALLLPEPAWVKAYQAASTSKLMKYKDFDDWFTAKHHFGDVTVVSEGTDYLDGAILLSVPRKLQKSVTRYV